MSEADIYLEQISGMSAFLDSAMADLGDEVIQRRPGPELNPLGFIYWHIIRIWDLDLNLLIAGRAPSEDAWHRGGFSEKMGYTPEGHGANGSGLGFGYTDAEVDEIPYKADVIRAYHHQLMEETQAYLAQADDAELRREFMFRDTPATPAARLQHTVGHSWNHIGEIRMTKSMLGFPDPTTPPRAPRA